MCIRDSSYGVRLRGVPMDDDGMNLEALETALREEPNAKFIYTIPNFQNPSGITTVSYTHLDVYKRQLMINQNWSLPYLMKLQF